MRYDDAENEEFQHAEFVREGRPFVLREVRAGRLSRTEAEIVAVNERLGPFAVLAPRRNYTPKNRQLWTIEMAMVWLISRDYDRVIDFDERYRRDCIDWYEVPFGRGGSPFRSQFISPTKWELRSGCPPTIYEVLDASSNFENIEMSFEVAKQRLWEKLISGKLIAAGVGSDTQKVSNIPAAEWLHLSFCPKKLEATKLKFETSETDFSYSGVVLPSNEIIKNWPETVIRRGRPVEFRWDIIIDVAMALKESHKREEREYTSDKLVEDVLYFCSFSKSHLIDIERPDSEPNKKVLTAKLREKGIINN